MYETNSNPEEGVNNIGIANQIMILFKCKSKKDIIFQMW